MPPIRNPLVTAAAAVVIIAGMHAAASIVNIILLSFLLAMAVTPLLEWLMGKGRRPGAAVALTIIIVFLGGLALASIVGTSIAQIIDRLPEYEPRLQDILASGGAFLRRFGIDSERVLTGGSPDSASIMETVKTALTGVLGLVSASFIVLLVVVFILLEASGHIARIRRGEPDGGLMARYFLYGKDVRTYLVIASLTGLMTAVGNTILLFILGVDFPILWGALSFFFSFVPSLGFLFSLLPPASLALLESGWGTAAIVAIGFFLINAIAENVVKPRFMKKGLEVSLLLVVLSMIVWTWTLGAMGTILGVPLTMVLYRVYTHAGTTSHATGSGEASSSGS
jgi:predicted PurR-regulated permease PerM